MEKKILRRDFLWVVAWACLLIGAVHAHAESGPGPGSGLEEQLKASIADAQKSLGKLESWQKTLYAEEVLPQFQRFIRDYRSSAEGIKTEVDYKSLRHYLFFHAQKQLKKKDSKIIVLLKPDLTCSKCTESVPAMTRLTQARLDRRGLSPIWINPEELNLANNSPAALEEHLIQLGRDKKADGVLVVRWAPQAAEDIDIAHADEKRFQVHVFLQVTGISTQQRQKEIMEAETFESAEARLLTDLFTDLGSKVEADQSLLAENGNEEILIEITGIKDFTQYMRIKAALQAGLKEVTSVEDRKFSKEQVVFAVYTKKSTEDVRKQMTSIPLDSSGGRLLTVVVR